MNDSAFTVVLAKVGAIVMIYQVTKSQRNHWRFKYMAHEYARATAAKYSRHPQPYRIAETKKNSRNFPLGQFFSAFYRV